MNNYHGHVPNLGVGCVGWVRGWVFGGGGGGGGGGCLGGGGGVFGGGGGGGVFASINNKTIAVAGYFSLLDFTYNPDKQQTAFTNFTRPVLLLQI